VSLSPHDVNAGESVPVKTPARAWRAWAAYGGIAAGIALLGVAAAEAPAIYTAISGRKTVETPAVVDPNASNESRPAGEPAPVASVAAPTPPGLTTHREELAWILELPPEAARAELDRRLAACKDAQERSDLVAIDRRLRLKLSPRKLALLQPPDLNGIRQALGTAAIPEQIALLGDASFSLEIRRAASDALARAGDPRALAGLVDAARTADPSGRPIAALALGYKAPDETARTCLASLLRDASPEVRASAAEALGSFGAPARAPIRESLQTEKAATVVAALLRSVGRAGGPEDLSLLTDHCKPDDPFQSVALEGARKLAAREGVSLPENLRADPPSRATPAASRRPGR
jgi:hypothetical protein